jgi:hypothetical protein
MEIIMRNFALLGASALVLALGVASASAEPFNPVTGYSNGPYVGQTYNGSLNEGRAAVDGNNGWTTGNPVLEQFHEGK